MNTSKLPKCLRIFASKIKEVSDERATGEGYWIYLVAGWWSPWDETHCIHEDTLRYCVEKMHWVEPCFKECCK